MKLMQDVVKEIRILKQDYLPPKARPEGIVLLLTFMMSVFQSVTMVTTFVLSSVCRVQDSGDRDYTTTVCGLHANPCSMQQVSSGIHFYWNVFYLYLFFFLSSG